MITRKIIINADDFGLCESVNEGIARAHTEGVLTSTTLMTNMPQADKAVVLAKSLPNLGIGVHLNLTEGKPLSTDPRVGRLTNTAGEFAFSVEKLCLMSLLSHSLRQAIEVELETQIQWMLNHDLKPTHLDSHKHFHCFPAIFGIVCKLAKQYGISKIRQPLECQHFDQHWPKPDKKGLRRAWILRGCSRFDTLFNKTYFKTSELLGIAHTGYISTTYLESVCLYNSSPIVEIMTHPGYMKGLDRNHTRLVEHRQQELEALCSKQIKAAFNKPTIQLVHYGQI